MRAWAAQTLERGGCRDQADVGVCKGGARGGLQLEGDYGRAPYATQREAMEEAVETVREQGGATCLNEFVNQSDLNKVYKLN